MHAGKNQKCTVLRKGETTHVLLANVKREVESYIARVTTDAHFDRGRYFTEEGDCLIRRSFYLAGNSVSPQQDTGIPDCKWNPAPNTRICSNIYFPKFGKDRKSVV